MPFLAGALLAALASATPAQDEAPNRYRITLGDDLRTARVEATVRLKGGSLRMADWGFPAAVELGWAEFVEGLEVRRDGAPVAVRVEPPGTWKVDAPDGTALALRYAVRLKHDDFPWDEAGGSDARPAVMGAAGAVWVTKALLVFSDEDTAAATVAFEVPPGWRVSTPWRPLPGAANAFAPDDLGDAYDNVVVAGRHLHRELSDGDMAVVLAVDPALGRDLPMIERTLRATLAGYRTVFGALPATRWLVALRRDGADDGEAFARSFVQTFRREGLGGSRIVWANVLAHELFHLWNPGRLPPADGKALEWWKEGVTEYVANRTLARTGAIDREEWLQKVGFHLGRFWGSRYLARPPGPGLEEAGKAKMQYWRLVYGGGATLGLLLDVELRAATGGRRSLDDVLRALERRHAAGGRPFTREDLAAALSEAAGRDLSGYLAAHATGTAWPPVEETLRKAGLTVVSFADEFYVRPDPAAAPAARALRRGLVGW